MSYTLDLPCPACAGSATTEIANAPEIAAEVEALRAFHEARLRPGVPPERLKDRVVFSQPPPIRLVRCDVCGTVLREPREAPDRITELYAGEHAAAGALAALFETQRREYRAQARRLARLLGRTCTGVEVGSYVGAFLAAARERGWRFEGVDVNDDASAFARGRGFAVTHGTLEDVPSSRRFDAVAFWNCFDQLADPRAAARLARERLAPGGVLALRVPNGGFYAAVRRRLNGATAAPATTMLAVNNLLAFPYRHGFTPDSLGRLLSETGFTVVRLVGDVLVRTADGWTRPWAALEERAVKAALRPVARAAAGAAPWLEAYARPS